MLTLTKPLLSFICFECNQSYERKKNHPCKDGKHRCRPCNKRASNRRYDASIKGKTNKREWRKQRPEQVKQYGLNYRDTKKGQIKNRELCKAHYWADPRYQRTKAIAKFHGIECSVLAVVKQRDKICQLCGSDANLEFDHKHPRSRGGETTIENLQLLCRSCNAFKNNRLFLPDGGMIVSI